MKIEIVGHYRGPKDANGNVKHSAVPQDFGARDEADCCFAPQRVGEKDFVSKTSGNRTDKRHDKRFHKAKPAALQCENNQNVESGDEHARQKWQPEEKFQRDGGAQNLREIARCDSDFAYYPEKQPSAA